MSIDALCKKIEDDSFIVRLSPSNIPKRLIDFARSQPEIRELVADLKKKPSDRLKLLRRIQAIVSTQTDYRYENPWDIPLSCYLLALYSSDRDLARAASMILRSAANSWWIPRVIDSLETLDGRNSETQYSGAADMLRAASVDVRELHSLQREGDQPIRGVAPQSTAIGSAVRETKLGNAKGLRFVRVSPPRDMSTP